MKSLISVLETSLPVFLLLIMGMLCRKKNFISRDGIDTLKKVVINLTLPFVLFQSFATAQYSLSSILIPVIIFFLCCTMLLLGFLTIRLSRSRGRLSPFLASGFEAGMLGFSLFGLLFPDESISSFAILVLGQEIFVFTIYKMLLTGKRHIGSILRDFLTSPTLIAVILGVIFGASGLYDFCARAGIGGIIDSVTSFVSAPTGAIILLTVGYDLVLRDIKWKHTFGFVVMRLVIAAIGLSALLLISHALLDGIIFAGAAILLFMLPPPYVIPIFADEPNERVTISSCLSVLTLITIIIFAVYSVIIQVL